MGNDNKHILIAEDDEDISMLLQFLLEEQGFKVTHAPDGGVAAQFISNNPPVDLALFDVQMPHKTGLELVAMARADDQWRSVPIVMLTSKAAPEDMALAFEAGANDYLLKPFDPQTLLTAIKAQLTR